MCWCSCVATSVLSVLMCVVLALVCFLSVDVLMLVLFVLTVMCWWCCRRWTHRTLNSSIRSVFVTEESFQRTAVALIASIIAAALIFQIEKIYVLLFCLMKVVCSRRSVKWNDRFVLDCLCEMGIVRLFVGFVSFDGHS